MSLLVFALAIFSILTGIAVIFLGVPRIYLQFPESKSTNYLPLHKKGDELKFVKKHGHFVYYDDQAISLADAEKTLQNKIRYGVLWAIAFLFGGLGALYSGVHLIRSVVSGN